LVCKSIYGLCCSLCIQSDRPNTRFYTRSWLLFLVQLGIIIALKMIPKTVLTVNECKAEEMMKNGKQKYWIVGSIIVLIIFQGSY
jgi:hypothetical protein